MSKQGRTRDREVDQGNSQKGKGDAEAANGLLEWTKSIVVAVLLFLLLRTFLVGTFVITSMLKSAVFASSLGSRSEQPASSSAERTELVPEP